MVMDIKNNTQDNVKVRMDLKEYYQLKELELQQWPNGNMLSLIWNSSYLWSKRGLHVNVLENWKCLGYAFNSYRCVNLRKGKLFAMMKSHDSNVSMEHWLPIAFVALPDQV